MKHILVVEDEKSMAETVKEYLCPAYEVDILDNAVEALAFIQERQPDAILLDLNLPDMHGFGLLENIQTSPELEKIRDSCAIIVITGQASMNTAIEAMRLGAQDFITKPIEPTRLKISISNALERMKLRQVVTTYQELSRDHFQGFIGISPPMQSVYKIIENAAQSKASVFITGESGTGKELAARAIHALSPRTARSFEVLNCAAIPHTLLESEIFGHVKGAFTGASTDRKGAASRANGGTIFLDEIGEMSVRLQAKLLRFIQSGTFTPVGSDNEKSVDVRFICATNRDPKEAVRKGLLREDLFYRLNVLPVEIPPLRTRGEDIILLAEHFLKQASAEENKDFKSISQEVKNLFMSYDWPGNVRELENMIRRIVVMNEGEVIGLNALNALNHPTEEDKDISAYADTFLPREEHNILHLAEYERIIILSALRACEGNISRAAKALNISSVTIHRKKKEWKKQGLPYD